MAVRPSMQDVQSLVCLLFTGIVASADIVQLEDAIKTPPEIGPINPNLSIDVVDNDLDASPDDLSNLTVTGRIIRDGERTVGGYSTVMRARWIRNNASESIVAAKSPFSPTRPSLTPEEKRKRLIQRAFREAKVWDRLRHVNVVEFLGILFQNEGGADFPEPYLLSPWMRLGSLAEYLARDKEGTVDRLNLVVQVTEGVKYLHDQGIWHGDLKCQNVLVQAEDEARGGQITAKLCDFGLSEVIAEDYPVTSTVGTGTSGFRPPELQDRSGKKNPSLDIFSLGGLILEVNEAFSTFDMLLIPSSRLSQENLRFTS
ncbi:hypothetical protein FRC01_005647 [Tulasnella sp. 417]|nr:hypothetical protein FRC01_005647 [Tulasnella sp. 417]